MVLLIKMEPIKIIENLKDYKLYSNKAKKNEKEAKQFGKRVAFDLREFVDKKKSLKQYLDEIIVLPGYELDKSEICISLIFKTKIINLKDFEEIINELGLPEIICNDSFGDIYTKLYWEF